MLAVQITIIFLSAINWKDILKIKEYSYAVAKPCKKKKKLGVLSVVLQVFNKQFISCLLHTGNLRHTSAISSGS